MDLRSELKAARAFEQKLLRELRAEGVKDCSILVAVSGGIDSVVLLESLKRLKSLLRIDLRVGHVHHGPGSKRQMTFRTKAQKFVSRKSKDLGLEFITNPKTSWPTLPLRSEADLRAFRLQFFKIWFEDLVKSSSKPCFVAFAHHQDDLLETRLIRLVRGTGLGGLKAMGLKTGRRVRPLIHFSRRDIEIYARARAFEWLEDPSNQEILSLRNWIRREWLPSLDKHRPGSAAALARSLEMIARPTLGLGTSDPDGLFSGGYIPRHRFMALSPGEKSTVLVQYLRYLHLRNYSQRHILEILKRLECRKRQHSFRLLGCLWLLDVDKIQASVEPGQSN